MKKYNIINNSLGWLCFVISAITYLLTMEPTASFWDCPEFISQGAKLEVGHPPGNPIFMLTARFFVTIFGNNIAHAAIAVNSMSALLSAATILLLFWTITHMVKKIMVRDEAEDISWRRIAIIMGAGMCGALAYTWSDTFWFSAVEGEVYAFSSFCTALVFWLILKWENRADEPHSDRYLVLIAYVIGLSIAVHLLNLLCIPAIVLVFYYRKWKEPDAKGSLIALAISMVVVALILYGLVPGFIKVAQYFELFFVNTLHMSYNSGVLIYGAVLVAVFVAAIFALYQGKNAVLVKTLVMAVALLSGLLLITDSVLVWIVLILACAAYLFMFCRTIPVRVFNVVVLSVFFIFVGYSSYALLLIRASANPPMNQNAPDNVFTLSSYLNREQYGQRPLFYGPVFAETYVTTNDIDGNPAFATNENGTPKTRVLDMGEAVYFDADGNVKRTEKATYSKVAKRDPNEPDRYVANRVTADYAYSPDLCIPFTRIYSFDPGHVQGYKGWSQYENPDVKYILNAAPQNLLNKWGHQGYATPSEIAPYLNNLSLMSRFENSSDYQKVSVWKPSFVDNLRFFFNYQLNHMYWRYFMWNFAGRQNDLAGNGEPNLGNWISGIPFIDNARLGDQSLLPDEYSKGNKGHNVFYMLPLLMGLFGIIWQSMCEHRRNPRRGIEQFWVVFFLFFMTGIAIVLYLNQTPGQPRERDYAFAGSFYAFAIWIGMGVPAISRAINNLFASVKAGKGNEEAKPDDVVKYSSAAVACLIGLLVPLQMVSQTWDDHDRSHRYTTRDFGANYMNSLEENAIIFTNGDNDTFPLWYTQEVEGERTDVRVVNLSYLSTDWYANQMLHPYYDAQAIKVLAQPADYAYDNLAYSSVADDYLSVATPALEGLRRFYAQGDGTLQTPYMYCDVDTAAAIKAFGVKPTQSDSINKLAYIEPIQMFGLSGRGFSLSKLLSFDMIANVVNDGFERPVYFATTVPSSYYLGLQPYMYSTGVAQQVTPFSNAPVSPMADKAYENIVSKFRWGGLDDPRYNQGLYLDETVRRMVSTMRSAITDAAVELIKLGDEPASEFAVEWAAKNGETVPANRYDMARKLLNLSEEKLPTQAMRYEGLGDATLASLYLQLYAATGNQDDLKRASAIIDGALVRYGQLGRYALSLGRGRQGSLAATDRYMLQSMPVIIGYKRYIDLQDHIKDAAGVEPELQTLNSLLDFESAMYPFTYAYSGHSSSAELYGDAERYREYSANIYEILRQAGDIVALHEKLGIDAEYEVSQLLAPYGLTIEDMDNLSR